jgi:hypothetical protein
MPWVSRVWKAGGIWLLDIEQGNFRINLITYCSWKAQTSACSLMGKHCGTGLGQHRELSMGECCQPVGDKTSLTEKSLQPECTGTNSSLATCGILMVATRDTSIHRAPELAQTYDQSGKEATVPTTGEACLRSQGAGLPKRGD